MNDSVNTHSMAQTDGNNGLNNLLILHHTPRILVVQTVAGVFDKFADDDIYGDFNLGLHVGDDASAVLANRAKLLRSLQNFGQVDGIFWLNQTHSDVVWDLDNESGHSLSAPNADALLTKTAGQALAIMTADCVPVAIFSDTDLNADLDNDLNNDEQADVPIACIHAGWQGLTNGIIAHTLQKMRQTHPNASFSAVIGAHIQQLSYEITRTLGQDIVRQVCQKQLTTLDENYLTSAIIADGETADKCLIDLYQLTRLELQKLGVNVVNEQVPCTYQDARFYSYRAQTHAKKPATGRMATVVVRLT